MMPLEVAEIATAVGGSFVGDGHVAVRNVTTDSRSVPEEALFVALEGEDRDGHDFVADALDAGARAVMVERGPQVTSHDPDSRPLDGSTTDGGATAVVVDDTWQALADLAGTVRGRVNPTVVAVTGSVGKTTTKDLIAAALAATGRHVTAAQASYNNELGVPLTCLNLEPETDVLVLEIGSRGIGDIRRLMPLGRPDVAVVTAVTEVHLATFGDLETVAAAKAELVEALPTGGTAVLNADDERVAAMADRVSGDVITFSGGASAGDAKPAVSAGDIRFDRRARASFVATTPWGRVDVRLPISGAHQIANGLAALGVVGALTGDVTAAAEGLRQARVSAWRSEIQEAGGVVVLNDAYNANPAAVRAAIDTLTRLEAERTWAVLGHMAELGPRAEEAHAAVGRYVVERGVDRLVVVGSAAAGIAEGARRAGLDESRLWYVDDVDAAADLLATASQPADAVLIKASRVAGLEAIADRLLT